jgi:acetyl-CoA acyltransferase
MKEVVIVDAVRSPVGRLGGGLASVRPDDLLSYVLVGLMERTGVDPALVEDVYAGCGNQAGEDNRDVARMALLLAGFPKEVGGVTVNRNCSSALEAVNLAAKSILVGEGMPSAITIYMTRRSAGATKTRAWTLCIRLSAWV